MKVKFEELKGKTIQDIYTLGKSGLFSNESAIMFVADKEIYVLQHKLMFIDSSEVKSFSDLIKNIYSGLKKYLINSKIIDIYEEKIEDKGCFCWSLDCEGECDRAVKSSYNAKYGKAIKIITDKSCVVINFLPNFVYNSGKPVDDKKGIALYKLNSMIFDIYATMAGDQKELEEKLEESQLRLTQERIKSAKLLKVLKEITNFDKCEAAVNIIAKHIALSKSRDISNELEIILEEIRKLENL